MGRLLTLGAMLVVLAFGIAIGFFNAQTITFHYLVGAVEMPLIALLIVELFLAVLLTLLVCSAKMLSLRAEARRLRRSLQDADAELNSLRALQIADGRGPTEPAAKSPNASNA